jgi:hypothetical protein
MADTQLYTKQAATEKANDIKAALALSKLRLFKSGLTVTQFTTKVELVAAECDFDGYTAGGYTLTAWTGPITDPNGGAILTSPLVNPAFSDPSDPIVGNDVGGWWVEDAGGTVRLVGQYGPARPIQGEGDGFPVVIQIVEGRNPELI